MIKQSVQAKVTEKILPTIDTKLIVNLEEEKIKNIIHIENGFEMSKFFGLTIKEMARQLCQTDKYFISSLCSPDYEKYTELFIKIRNYNAHKYMVSVIPLSNMNIHPDYEQELSILEKIRNVL